MVNYISMCDTTEHNNTNSICLGDLYKNVLQSVVIIELNRQIGSLSVFIFQGAF